MDKFTVRRKILRGSLSAPVILTVASPGSLAAASTTCLVNTNQTETARPPLFQPEKTEDGYLRKTIDVCQFKDSQGNLIEDEFYVDKNGSWRSIHSDQSFTPSGDQVGCASKREVLVYVDSQGQETWYGWPSSSADGSFTSIGCWHSLLIKP